MSGPVASSPGLALFDLDGTLIPRDSDHAFGEFLVKLGWADGAAFRQANDRFYEDYLHGRLDMAAYVDFATAPWRERPPGELSEVLERFVDEIVRPMLHGTALDLVRRHRDAGDRLAIVTATNEVVTRPIAALFGIEHLLAVEPEEVDGRFSGRYRGTHTYREGKVRAVEAFLAARGTTLEACEDSVFYSDSINDLPLLQRVRRPVATNADDRLRAIATARGWATLELFAAAARVE